MREIPAKAARPAVLLPPPRATLGQELDPCQQLWMRVRLGEQKTRRQVGAQPLDGGYVEDGEAGEGASQLLFLPVPELYQTPRAPEGLD